MTHDPLCTFPDYPYNICWVCELIAKADERGATNALDKARQLITALACPITIAEGHCEECEQYREVLACIESLRSKP